MSTGTAVRSAVGLWLAALTAATPPLFGVSSAGAEREPKVSRRLHDKREQLDRVQRELERERRRATQIARKERSLFEELDRIEHQLRQKGRELRGLQEKLQVSTQRLQRLRTEIGLTQAQLDQLQAMVRRRLRAIYKQGRFGYVRVLLSAEDLADGGRRMKYLAAIAGQDQRMVAAYGATLEALQKRHAELESSKAELVKHQRAVEAKRAEILDEQGARRRLLALVQERKREHLAAIHQLEQAARELQDLIGRLQGEARAQTKRRPGAETPLVPGRSDGRGAFAALKGRLPWPTPGTVVSSFGRQEHPRYKTVTFNRGIEIAAGEQRRFVAVFDGTVLYADWFKGYGRLIILDHGDGYYTVYAHASQILVKVGDRVSRDQPIGLVGEGGDADGAQLYFEVRHRGRPQDPLAWLAPS